MFTLHGSFTQDQRFFGGHDVFDLIQTYGSPLYVYNEMLLRKRCRDLKNLVLSTSFVPHYSVKANTNIHLLKIIREEGFHADVMSPGELFLAKQSGFQSDELFFIPNNASIEDMQYAIDEGVLTSVDSLSQLEQYGILNPGGKVAIRLNTGIGVGHHEKVITAGKKTKFGINPQDLGAVKTLLDRYQLQLVGINQHIGSLFMDATHFVESIHAILALASQFENLEFVDLGGGFGIPYHKQEGQAPLDLQELSDLLNPLLEDFAATYPTPLTFQIEPGRYIACECGVLLGQVTALKENGGVHYLGTDIGFNVLQRPLLYDAHHDLEIYRRTSSAPTPPSLYTVVGNICESGDILRKDCMLPSVEIGDLLGVMDVGAYGFCMSSSYNQRLRCAEVLITQDDTVQLIRKRETFEDLLRPMLV